MSEFSERWAARKHPRFRFFVEAKNAYEEFAQELEVHFDAMLEEHYRRAREDPRIREAERGFTAAIELSTREGALADAAVARYQLGLVRHIRGELDEAAGLIRAALEVLGSLPDRDRGQGVSACLYHLGVIALKRGHLAVAVRELRRSRQLDEASGDLHGVRSCDVALAACAAAGADIDTASLPGPSDDDAWAGEDDVEPASDEGAEGEPAIESGRTVPYSQRELIWLASYSVEANDGLMAHLDSLGDQFGRPVGVSRVAFGSFDPAQRTLARPEPDQHLCAVILMLERTGLEDGAFQEFAGYCMRRVMAVPDFRLLVYLHDLTLDELRDVSDRERLWARLFDTTQIAESPSLEQLRRTLVPYVRRVEHIRAATRWKETRPRLAVACGNLALGILAVVAFLALLGFPAWLLKSKLDWLGPYGPRLASLVLGILAFPLQAPLIFLLLRGMRATMLAPKDNVYFMRWVFIGAVIMLGANHFQHALGGPHSWLFLGLAVGVLLDSMCRSGRQARRQVIDLEALMERVTDPGLGDAKTTVLQGDPLNPFSCPLLPAPSVRVFISYTPSSAKGSRLAAALHRGLKEVGAAPFLDRASIPIGASWRRALNHHLGECDAFVCILDEKSVHREWVAAELLAALEAHRLTGTPEIFILMDPAIQHLSQPMLPVFRGVVSASASPHIPGRPQILWLNAQTRSSLVWALAPGRFMPMSVLTRAVALVIAFAMILPGWVGGMGIFAGYLLGFLAMLEKMAKFPFTSGLAERGWLEPMTLLTAFWLGFTGRATIAWGYERDHGREMGVTIPALATCGLAFALFLFVQRASILEMGWVAVLVIASWLMVASAMRAQVK